MKHIRSNKTTLLMAALMMAPAGLAVASAPEPAAAAGEEFSLADLMNIKLQTGSFLELDLAKSPLSMTIIDREKVKLSGARDLSEILEIYVPGFQYMYNRWNGKIWGMRGVANDRNTKFIVLVNGHKMNTEARDGFFQEISIGLMGDVERIEVLRGPAGLVYGSGAIAGIVNIVTKRTTANGADVAIKAGTWSNFGNTFNSAQGSVYGKIADDQSVSASLGWEKSDGLGNGVSTIYGRPLWPYPFWFQNSPGVCPASVPADGSAQQTPGNWKASVDYEIKGVRVYSRFTHQVQEAGGLFIKDPWPQYAGSPAAFKTDVKNYQTQIAALQAKVDAGTATSADNLNLVDLNARLRDLVLQNLGPVLIDGKTVELDSQFWGSTESSGNNRREYVADNILVDVSYDLALGENTLKLHGGFDGNSNIIQMQMRPGYENAEVNERNSRLNEAFGERRYTMGATYLLRNIPKLQLAVGAEQRFDDIGEDLFGRNSQDEKANHKIVSDVLYSNTALFTEGWYDIRPDLGVDFGLRWDGHTRTIDNGGTINGKIAGVYTINPKHTVKLIFQSSSNNATADNYEYNRNNFNDEGTAFAADHFYEKTTSVPNVTIDIVPGISLEKLHELKPEKVYSFELTSTHDLGKGLSLAPSVSYNMVRDLFAWSQQLFRVVNVGQYDNLNIDLQADWKSRYLEVGANHSMQMVVNTDVGEQGKTFENRGYNRTYKDANGKVLKTSAGLDSARTDWYTKLSDGTYVPTSNIVEYVTLNPVRDQITVDGSNFMSFATHTTKLWADLKPTSWLTFHNDVRVFWGLWGRDSATKVDDSLGFQNLGIATDPIIKWNASLHTDLPGNWSVGVYVNDILGVKGDNTQTNTIRWNQSYDIAARDLFAVDYRSYALEIKRSF